MQKRCLKRGKVVPQGHGRKSEQKYCSPKCWQIRNTPPKDDLLDMLNKADNITLAANLFGADKTAIYRWMKQYGIRKQVVYVG